MPESQITPEQITLKLVEGLKILKEELKAWRAESRRNEEKIIEIEAKLDEVLSKGCGSGIMPAEIQGLEEKAARLSQQYVQIQTEMKNIIEFNKKVNALKRMLDELGEKSEVSDDDLNTKIDTLEKTVLSMSEKIVEVGKIKSSISDIKGSSSPEIEAKLSSLRLMLEEIGDGLSQLNRLKMQLDKVESETQRNMTEMTEIRDRLEQVGMGEFDAGPPEGVQELRDRIDELSDRMGKGFAAGSEEEFMKKVKSEMNKWLEDTKENSKALEQFKKDIKQVEAKAGETKQLKEHLNKINKDIEVLQKKNVKMDGLANVLTKHGDEIDQVYSFIGKEKLDIENLEASLKETHNKLSNREKESALRLTQIEKMKEMLKVLKAKDDLSDKDRKRLEDKMQLFAKEIGKVHELGEMGPKYFTDIKTDLDAWHNETKHNQQKLVEMRNKIGNLNQKIEQAVKLKVEVSKLGEGLSTIVNDTAQNFSELKKAILMHGEEFESLYSLIGKEELDIEKMGMRLTDFRKKLAEWRLLNDESIKQSKYLQSKLDDLRGKVSGKKGLPIVINELEEVTKEIELLKMEEQRMDKMEVELEELRKKIVQIQGMKTEVKDLENTLATIADNMKSFQELRKDLSRHADELLAIHAAVGKKDIEIKRLDATVSGFHSKLKDWEKATYHATKQTQVVAQKLERLSHRLTGKEGIPKLSRELYDLTKEIKLLEREYISLDKKQKDMLLFDDKIEHTVQKALRDKITKKELEDEFNKIQSIKKKTFPFSSIKEGTKEAARLTSGKQSPNIKSKLTQFLNKLEKASKQDKDLVWEEYEKKILKSIDSTLRKEKTRIKKARLSGKDVSKQNLIYAKAEMRFVTLENAFSSRDLKKVAALIGKIAELKAHL
ncbi:hypothetical protein K8R43_01810 [archaeon]|nr:hypothetical protein [archaeon]